MSYVPLKIKLTIKQFENSKTKNIKNIKYSKILFEKRKHRGWLEPPHG
jgi:hypothetical protein